MAGAARTTSDSDGHTSVFAIDATDPSLARSVLLGTNNFTCSPRSQDDI